jgi:bacterioferritin
MAVATTRPPQKASAESFLYDVQTLRNRARQHIEEGAVTPNYGADAKQGCKVLN